MKSNGIKYGLKQKDHISICICTYKRPQMLIRLIESIYDQIIGDEFIFSIVIVDNDPVGSASTVIQKMDIYKDELLYCHVSEPNIAVARNESLKHAVGNLIAFIDDDEFADKYWLSNMYDALKKLDCDCILGPVKPHFEQSPPKWIVKGKICERKGFYTGDTITNTKYTKTGNVLIKRDVIDCVEGYFDPKFGKSGGSDSDLFKKLISLGKIIKWCNEAVVFETVPIERQKRAYYIKRAFTRGMTSAWHMPFFSFSTVKSLSAIILYTLFLPFLLFTGQALFMKFLIKLCDHLGKILTYMGIKVVKERPYK